jgi:dolichyl-phosphate-mannose-protein mannosyltransferase
MNALTTSPRRASLSKKTLATSLIVAGILFAGLALRLYLAPAEGNGFDIGVNQGWAKSAVQLGLAKSYSEQVDGNMLPNYPPFSMLTFTSMGYAYKAFFSPEFESGTLTYRILIKLPAIFADLGAALLMFFVLRKWKGQRAGYVALVAMTFHPAALYNSAIWGQTDSIFSFLLAAGLACYAWGWFAFAGGLAMLAVLTKMQAVMLGPLFAVLFLRAGWKGFLKGTLSALLVTVIVLLPFATNLPGVWTVYSTSVGYYPIVTSAAYNLWWALLSDSGGSVNDTTLLFGVISYRHLGLLLVGGFYLATLALLWKRLKPNEPFQRLVPALYLAGSTAAYIFFMFNTQMHERYLYPFVTLGLPVVFLGRRAAFYYCVTCVIYVFNMMGWLPYGAIDRALFATFPAWDGLLATSQLFFFAFWFGLIIKMSKESSKKGLGKKFLAWMRSVIDKLDGKPKTA